MTGDETERNQPGPCSFCKKTSEQVRKLIAGPSVFICDECVAVCVDIIEDGGGPQMSRSQLVAEALRAALVERGTPGGASAVGESGNPASCCSLCRMPVLLDESILVEGRGLLCRACISAVQAAASEAAPDSDADNE